MIEDKKKKEKKPIASPSPLQKKNDMGGKKGNVAREPSGSSGNESFNH